MTTSRFLVLALAALAAACTSAPPAPDSARLAVFDAERAFARSMAERDLEAFTGHLAVEAIFLGGAPGEALVGREQVVAGWSQFFAGPTAPFSWEPEQVEVLESGTLALSTGPVRDPGGKVIARFTTIWRWQGSAGWKVVFDRGCPVCVAASGSAVRARAGAPTLLPERPGALRGRVSLPASG